MYFLLYHIKLTEQVILDTEKEKTNKEKENRHRKSSLIRTYYKKWDLPDSFYNLKVDLCNF